MTGGGEGAPGGRSPGLGTHGDVYQLGDRSRIGREHGNDIKLDDILVSRHHADVVRRPGGGFEVVDKRSFNGTYVNGRRITRATVVTEGSIIGIGHHNLRLENSELVDYVDNGQVTFAALGLRVDGEEKARLDSVSFTLTPGKFLGVLGATGAGKSTLMKALVGSRPADVGQVLYNGRNLYWEYADLRGRIGYVPQDDALHKQLTVRQTLNFVARLRLPPDERRQQVENLIRSLGLARAANSKASFSRRTNSGKLSRKSSATQRLGLIGRWSKRCGSGTGRV